MYILFNGVRIAIHVSWIVVKSQWSQFVFNISKITNNMKLIIINRITVTKPDCWLSIISRSWLITLFDQILTALTRWQLTQTLLGNLFIALFCHFIFLIMKKIWIIVILYLQMNDLWMECAIGCEKSDIVAVVYVWQLVLVIRRNFIINNRFITSNKSLIILQTETVPWINYFSFIC